MSPIEACDCELDLTQCPDQSELVSGSLFPDMSCQVVLAKLALQEIRIQKNSDSSIQRDDACAFNGSAVVSSGEHG
jgi:hypothetical protein